MGPKSHLPKQARPSLPLNPSAEAGDGRANSSRWGPAVHRRPRLCGVGGILLEHRAAPRLIALSFQEPVGPPTPKRPRGRPKGSKNKGPKTAPKVEPEIAFIGLFNTETMFLNQDTTRQVCLGCRCVWHQLWQIQSRFEANKKNKMLPWQRSPGENL